MKTGIPDLAFSTSQHGLPMLINVEKIYKVDSVSLITLPGLTKQRIIKTIIRAIMEYGNLLQNMLTTIPITLEFKRGKIFQIIFLDGKGTSLKDLIMVKPVLVQP